MDEYQGTGQQPQQPLSPGQEGGPAYYRQPLPEPPPGRRMTPPPNRGRRGGPGWGKTVITAIVAGLIGALLILLVMPAVFGVNRSSEYGILCHTF